MTSVLSKPALFNLDLIIKVFKLIFGKYKLNIEMEMDSRCYMELINNIEYTDIVKQLLTLNLV